ncbi:MAG TPA: helix-turn-helix transcriptional regulator [Candidatus Olsenella excrementigallinarum]|nr:helix-turn-helix transcriptional regulator [Candidatus Olsenella excrementigallinarum]
MTHPENSPQGTYCAHGGARRALGLSQEELAWRLYVSRVAVSHWETSRTLPDVQSMLLLTNLFGTTVDELVRGGVDETCEMVEKDKRRTKTFAVASTCS